MGVKYFVRKYLGSYAGEIREGFNGIAKDCARHSAEDFYVSLDDKLVVQNISHDTLVILGRRYKFPFAHYFSGEERIDIKDIKENMVDGIISDDRLYGRFKELVKKGSAKHALRAMGLTKEAEAAINREIEEWSKRPKYNAETLETALKTSAGQDSLLINLAMNLT